MGKHQIIKQLNESTLLCLSSNRYYLNIIKNDSLSYRIDSEDQFIYFSPLNPQQLFNLSIQKTNIFIVINKKLHWNIFILLQNEGPCCIFTGTLSQNYNQNLISNNYLPAKCSVVNVHQTKNRLLFVLNNFEIHQILFIDKHKTSLQQTIKNSSKKSSPINLNSQIIYPKSQSPYLTQFYLPSPETNIMIDSLFSHRTSANDQKTQSFHLYFVVQQISKNIKGKQFRFQKFSIYQCILYPQQKILASGNLSVLNVQNKFLGIYSLTKMGNQILIQTDKQIYLWSTNQQKPIISFNHEKFTFINPFTLYQKSSQTNTFVSIAKQKNQTEIQCKKLVKVTFKKDKGLAFQEVSKFQHFKQTPLLYFGNLRNPQQSYIFNSDYSITKFKNLSNDSVQCIFSDNSVVVEETTFVRIEPFANILYVEKKNWFSKNRIILTNSLIEIHHQQYHHNLPIQHSEIVSMSSVNGKQVNVILSSPLIGTLALSILKLNQNDITIKVNQSFKLLSGYEILAVSQSLKTFVNPHQIVFDLQLNKMNKLPSASVSKLFDSSTDFIENAVILQKSGFFVFSLQDQLHIFEGNNQKSLKRKFIHCFNSQVKNIFKLNDVNLIGVELFQNHLQENSHQQHPIEENDNSSGKIEVYLILDDKLIPFNTINYKDGFQNRRPLSFLTHINTVAHYVTFIYNKIILASSEETFRYNPQKVKIQIFQFPSLIPSHQKIDIVPLINIQTESKNMIQNHFLLKVQPNNSQNTRIFIGSFMRKFLIKKTDEIKLNFECVLTSANLKEKIMFSIMSSRLEENEVERKLLFFTQKSCYNITLRTGKIDIESTSIPTQKYICQLVKLNQHDDLREYQGLQKIQSPLKIFSKQQSSKRQSSNPQNNQKLFTNTNSYEQILIVNNFQIWYCLKNEKEQNIKPISVYTMVNNDFLEFRNNLSVEQLEQPEFMKLFSQKLPILQVKYLSNKAIIVLFQRQITILQVGENSSLNVKQELIFAKIQQGRSGNQILMSTQNEYSSIKIIKLLDKCSSTDIFLKDAQSRLYLLVFDSKSLTYSIRFDRNLEQDIVSIIRTNLWDQSKISLSLLKDGQTSSSLEENEQIVLKKDSQLIIKDLLTGKQKSRYV